jgi:hypothetical protein
LPDPTGRPVLALASTLPYGVPTFLDINPWERADAAATQPAHRHPQVYESSDAHRRKENIEHMYPYSGFRGQGDGDSAEAEVDHRGERFGVGVTEAASVDEPDLGVDAFESTVR